MLKTINIWKQVLDNTLILIPVPIFNRSVAWVVGAVLRGAV